MLPQEYCEKVVPETYIFKDDVVLVSEHIIGVVRDVSLEAISFQYMDRGQSLSGTDFDIMAPESRFFLAKDEYIIGKFSKKYIGVRANLNTCCLILSNLSEFKKRRLWSFIQKNCIGSISKHRDAISDKQQRRLPKRIHSGRFRASNLPHQTVVGSVRHL